MRIALRTAGGLVGLLVLVVAVYAINIALGMRAAPSYDGTITGIGVSAPVEILRDARGVAHIRASGELDAMFGQGYAEGTDRLFQLDLLRRFVYGRLSEVLGSAVLPVDEEARAAPVRDIVARQWQALDSADRKLLAAYAAGVNAAMQHEPTPPEFRALMYTMEPWQPQDSLAVGFATTLDLIDDWNNVAARTITEPLSDPCYDAPVTDGLGKVRVPAHGCAVSASRVAMLLDSRAPVGSNEWAAGAAHTTTGRALLANDPHLRLGIPGVWYLVEISAPGYHVAGASLAGTPGVILGHNQHVAWGATNGSVVSLMIYDPPAKLDARNWYDETFLVRFGRPATKRYYRDARYFGADVRDASGRRRFVLVDWNGYYQTTSPLATFSGLDRATSVDDALRVLRGYPGPTQNFVLADTSGRVAYQLAGEIPFDPGWGRIIHPASDLKNAYPMIAFGNLPHVAASRDAVVWTANNKMYGAGYPYRLSAGFTPPYRAARIAQLLQARKAYDVPYFSAMQMDTLSLSERELAAIVLKDAHGSHYRPGAWQNEALVNLALWDGRFTPDSKGASTIFEIRRQLARVHEGMLDAMLASRASRVDVLTGFALNEKETVDIGRPWSKTGAVVVEHPLAALGLGFLNGSTFAGNGDAYTVHVQNYGFSQSFRAVWDVGNWDGGGITIPQGESGVPGSGHYTDEAGDWVAGRLLPLPFSTAAVQRATVHRFTITP
jgi:penicillin amidase